MRGEQFGSVMKKFACIRQSRRRGTYPIISKGPHIMLRASRGSNT